MGDNIARLTKGPRTGQLLTARPPRTRRPMAVTEGVHPTRYASHAKHRPALPAFAAWSGLVATAMADARVGRPSGTRASAPRPLVRVRIDEGVRAGAVKLWSDGAPGPTQDRAHSWGARRPGADRAGGEASVAGGPAGEDRPLRRRGAARHRDRARGWRRRRRSSAAGGGGSLRSAWPGWRIKPRAGRPRRFPPGAGRRGEGARVRVAGDARPAARPLLAH